MAFITYLEEEYLVFLSEYELKPNKSEDNEYFEEKDKQLSFRVADYHLFLEEKSGSLITQEALPYSGGILIVKKPLEEYAEYEDMFSYETVQELIFKDGILITTVDHSKAMLRIRRNVERKLRSLSSARDRHCILKFMHKTVICDYRQSRVAYVKKKLARNFHQSMSSVKEKWRARHRE